MIKTETETEKIPKKLGRPKSKNKITVSRSVYLTDEEFKFVKDNGISVSKLFRCALKDIIEYNTLKEKADDPEYNKELDLAFQRTK